MNRLLRLTRLVLLGVAVAATLGGCYVAPVRPAAVVVRPALATCWHRGWWGPWGWHPGRWGPCR